MMYTWTVMKHTVLAYLIACLLTDLSIGCCASCNTDCQDLRKMGHTISGVYHVAPEGTIRGYDVYCDMEADGGGWLVFQRRVDGTVDFYRDWYSNVYGFGNTSHEHWMGLYPLHVILQQGNYELRIEMLDWEGGTAYATYRGLTIGNSTENFKLTVGQYKGNAGEVPQWSSVFDKR